MSLFRPGNAGARLRLALAIVIGVSAPALASAQQGTISGRVTSDAGQPLAEARVFLVGANGIGSTSADGRYTLRSAPGTIELRVLRVGFTEQKKSVVVPAGGAVTVDFVMATAVVKLTEVVTTATGQQRRVELGNSVATLGDISQKVETAPVTSLSDLLVGKAPGVQVLAGSMTGSAPTIRIRGIKSISLSSEPIYVIDGVRMNAAALSLSTGGTTGSYLNALNPEEIADIEIVKGPSAATLYGTDAANGVIVITTKKGVAGPARWTLHAGTGTVRDRNDYPTQYALWGHKAATPTTPTRCTLVSTVQAIAPCIADSTTSYNLLADASVSPITSGYTRESGAQVSGGTDNVRYFLSGDFSGEGGTLKMPDFSQRFLDSTGSPLRNETVNPEYLGRTSMRTNVNATLNPKLDVSVTAAYTKTGQRLPPVDNNTISYMFQAYGNPGFKPTIACQTNPTSCLGFTNKGGLGEDLHGYAQFTPANMFQRLNNLDIDRFITSGSSQWRPLAWMQNDATIGMDMGNRDLALVCRFAECPATGTNRLGFVFDQKSIDRNISAKIASTSTWQARPQLNLKTTIGADYTNKQFEFASGEGDNLPPGAQTAGAGATQFAGSSFIQADKTLGYYAQELASIRDNLFLTLAARTDQNSAFGTKFQRVVYPKASASYLISDESFFPKTNALSSLRLRGSFGASGVQPGSVTALQTFSSTTVSLATSPVAVTGTDAPGLVAAALGNPDLKPERSSEKEFGFEAGLFKSRVNLDVTYYNNLTKDALIAQSIAPSAGPSQLTVTKNLGSVRNSGIEATITTTILDNKNFGWNLTVGGSHNTNKIESLGTQPCTVDPVTCPTGTKPNPTNGTGANRDSLGLPIRGNFARQYHYSDVNGNGIIESSEVIVDPNFTFLGYGVPRDLVTVQNGFDMFNQKLHLNILLDYRGGFSVFNNTTSFLCQQKDTCYDETHKNASLDDQARLVALRFNGTNAGYFENGQFWRLREVGATLTLPQVANRVLQSRDASLTVTGRNLHVWTKYKGTDPESSFGGTTATSGNVQTDLLTTAPPSYFTVRLNLHY
jgi:TonB-linked SusC/RagA family outer membrane protein